MADNEPKVLLRSDENDGHLAVVELSGGGRPPLHGHDFDETFYILEGELTFQLGEELITRRAGELAIARHGIPTPTPIGAKLAHLLRRRHGGDERACGAGCGWRRTGGCWPPRSTWLAALGIGCGPGGWTVAAA
jgi:Cupin domain